VTRATDGDRQINVCSMLFVSGSELEPAQTGCAGQEVTLRSEGRCWLAVTVGSSCGQQINDRFVGPMVGGLEAAVGSVLRIGSMVEAAVGKGTTQPLMEEQKQ
jgi:hypothetical protein